MLASEDQYENEFLQHPPIEPYAPTTSTCNEPIISLNQPTCSPPIPITTNAEQNLSGLETWARNLPSPQTFSQLNQALTFSNAHYASRQPPQSNSLWLNQQPAPFTHSANVSLPPFWELNVELWFSTAEHAFPANGIFNEHKRFSLVLGALDIKMIQKIQHVVRSNQTDAQQQLINEIFDQKLNKIIETLQAPNTTTHTRLDNLEATEQIITIADLLSTTDLMTLPDKCTGPDSILTTKTAIFSNKKTSRFDFVGRRRRIGSKHRPTLYYLR